MTRNDIASLKDTLYKYWMERVPELDEGEAIDHLEWELRNMGFIPPLVKCRTSRRAKARLKKFLREKGVS